MLHAQYRLETCKSTDCLFRQQSPLMRSRLLQRPPARIGLHRMDSLMIARTTGRLLELSKSGRSSIPAAASISSCIRCCHYGNRQVTGMIVCIAVEEVPNAPAKMLPRIQTTSSSGHPREFFLFVKYLLAKLSELSASFSLYSSF